MICQSQVSNIPLSISVIPISHKSLLLRSDNSLLVEFITPSDLTPATCSIRISLDSNLNFSLSSSVLLWKQSVITGIINSATEAVIQIPALIKSQSKISFEISDVNILASGTESLNKDNKIEIECSGELVSDSGFTETLIEEAPIHVNRVLIENSLNDVSSPFELNLSFNITSNNLPNSSKSLLSLYLPSQVLRDPSSNLSIQLSSGGFTLTCGNYSIIDSNLSELPADSILSEKSQLNVISNRILVEIFCIDGDIKSSETTDFSMLISGIILPRSLEESDDLIIEVRDQTSKKLYQSSEISNNSPRSISSINPTKFQSISYSISQKNQNTMEFNLKAIHSIVEYDTFIIDIPRSDFYIFTQSQHSFSCSQGQPSTILISPCNVVENKNSLRIQIPISAQTISQNSLEVFLSVSPLLFLPNLRNNQTTIEFSLVTQSSSLISFENFEQTIDELVSMNKYSFELNDVIPSKVKSLSGQLFEFKFNFKAENTVVSPSAELRVEWQALSLGEFSIEFTSSTFCSAIVLGQPEIGINCVHANNGVISFPEFAQQLRYSILPTLITIKVHNILTQVIRDGERSVNLDFNWKLIESNQKIVFKNTKSATIQLDCFDQNCQECLHFSETCSRCQSGFLYSNLKRLCVQSCGDNEIANEENDSCIVCQTQSEGICLKCERSDLKACVKCSENYTLSSSGICVMNEIISGADSEANTRFANVNPSGEIKITGLLRKFALTSAVGTISLLVITFEVCLKANKSQSNVRVPAAVILLLVSVIELSETPYLLYALAELSAWKGKTLLVVSYGYITSSLLVYFAGILSLLKTFLSDDSSSIFCFFDLANDFSTSRVKAGVNFVSKSLVAIAGKSFVMVYSNIFRVKGWFTLSDSDFSSQELAVSCFVRVLAWNTGLNAAASIGFALCLFFEPSEIDVNSSDISSPEDFIAYKGIVSVICIANTIYLKTLSSQLNRKQSFNEL